MHPEAAVLTGGFEESFVNTTADDSLVGGGGGSDEDSLLPLPPGFASSGLHASSNGLDASDAVNTSWENARALGLI
jgi:hypothetical protein